MSANRIAELYRKKEEAYHVCRRILTAVGDDDLKGDALARYNAAFAQMEELDAKLKRETRLEREQNEFQRLASQTEPGGLQVEGASQRVVQRATDRFGYRDPVGGHWVISRAAGESIVKRGGTYEANDGLNIGEWASGIVTGNWGGRAGDYAALSGSDDSAGGFLVPDVLATSVVDAARARMQCIRAGVQTIPMPPAASCSIARLTTDATASWRREGSSLTASQPVFDKITMYPRTMGILIPVTIELMEDCANMASVLENAITGAAAVALDSAILNGAGTTEPLGVCNMTDINSTDNSTAVWDYDDLCDLWLDPMLANSPEEPTAFIMTPTGENFRRKLKNGDGSYFTSTMVPLGEVPFLPTTSCPSGTIVAADWTQVILGMRTQMKMEVLRAGTGSDDAGDNFNATTQLGVWLRLYLRCDVHCARPT